MPIHKVFALCIAKMVLGMARAAADVSRSAANMQPRSYNWWKLDWLTRSSLLMWLSLRLTVGRVTLGIAETLTDLAGWLVDKASDKGSRGPSDGHQVRQGDE